MSGLSEDLIGYSTNISHQNYLQSSDYAINIDSTIERILILNTCPAMYLFLRPKNKSSHEKVDVYRHIALHTATKEDDYMAIPRVNVLYWKD